LEITNIILKRYFLPFLEGTEGTGILDTAGSPSPSPSPIKGEEDIVDSLLIKELEIKYAISYNKVTFL
jgi:hypothetical protein